MLKIYRYLKAILYFVGVSLIMVNSSCKNDLESTWIESDQKSIAQWLESREDMTLLTEALKTTGHYNRLGARAGYTLFAPNNAAMEKLYAGDQSLRQDSARLEEILFYHLISREYDSEDFIDGGFLRDTTQLGLKITVDLIEGDYLVNGRSKILEPDNNLTNAVLHVVDEVILVPNLSLYEAIRNEQKFSLFKSAIDQNSQLVEFLSSIKVDSIQPSTIIVVSDDVYKSDGVNSLDDLKSFAVEKWASVGIQLDADMALERYILYHIIPQGNTNKDGFVFMAEMKNNIYHTKGNSSDFIFANFTNEGKAYINSKSNLEDIQVVNLVNETSNFLYANGVLHTSDSPLEVVSSDIFESWNIPFRIVKEFEDGYYFEQDKITGEVDMGFYDNSGCTYEGLRFVGGWFDKKMDEGGPFFLNKSNVPGWVEFPLENIIPDRTYSFYYKGKGFSYSYVFVYMYPVDEADLFEADPYKYKLKDGASEVSLHAEKGKFEYPGNPKAYMFSKKLKSTTYKIRFEVRGKNSFLPGKLTLFLERD